MLSESTSLLPSTTINESFHLAVLSAAFKSLEESRVRVKSLDEALGLPRVQYQLHIVEHAELDTARRQEIKQLISATQEVFSAGVLEAILLVYERMSLLAVKIDPYQHLQTSAATALSPTSTDSSNSEELRPAVEISRPFNPYLLYKLALIPVIESARMMPGMEVYIEDFTPWMVAASTAALWRTESEKVKQTFVKLADIERELYLKAYPTHLSF
ncbi:uncharacterized protein V2V93DRAFT_368646 [Kockiozyma suomiensis]|uniref:uncharacterized protein n=1 Tax=Kockiozyma suomiensis TaxID=1337062 RepID=UPI003343FBAF